MRTKEVQYEYNSPLFFIGWMPVPDPFYHSPVETPYYNKKRFLSLLRRISGINIDGYMLSLNHILRDKGDMHVNTRITEMIRKKKLSGFFNIKTEFFLDSGAFQRTYYKRVTECKEIQLEDIINFQLKLGATKICHLDVLGNIRRTVENAKVYRDFENITNNKISIYYVIQGNKIEEYLTCLRKLIRIGCDKFALGNLYYFRRKYGPELVIRLINKIKRKIGDSELHLLGVGDLALLLRVKKFITSFDTTYPIRSATLGKTILYTIENQLLKLRVGSKPPVGQNTCLCPVCRKFDVFINEYNFPKRSGIRTIVRHLRAIHNAYTFKKILEVG